jgi:hypothetical protein
MNSGNELPNPYSGGPVVNESPKRFNDRWRTVLYVLYIVVTVAIMFVAPQPAKIVAITAWLLAWALFNTWHKDWAGSIGGGMSFSILVITALASWIANGTMRQSHAQDFMHVNWSMWSITQSLEDFRKSHNHYPESLADVRDEDMWQDDLEDAWGRPFLYSTEDDNYRLETLGRDGVPGGTGIDTDWFCDSNTHLEYGHPDNRPFIPLPLWQFLFETPSSSVILILAVPMCLIAGHGFREDAKRVKHITRSMIFSGCIAALVFAVVSVFLSMFHIAASQSGH